MAHIILTNDRDAVQEWKQPMDHLALWLVPRHWWSWKAWTLARSTRRQARLVLVPSPRTVNMYMERLGCCDVANTLHALKRARHSLRQFFGTSKWSPEHAEVLGEVRTTVRKLERHMQEVS